MTNYSDDLIAFLCTIVLTLISGSAIIPLLKKLKAGQNILGYVDNHAAKAGTATMGGFIFALPAILVFLISGRKNSTLAFLSIAVSLAFLAVGFVDDFIKIKSGKNEGLTPLQKIIFQSAISIATAIFIYFRGYTKFFIPFFNIWIDFRFWGALIAFFVFLATSNCVNLTDGLDGLAGGVSYVFFLLAYVLIILQTVIYNENYVLPAECQNVAFLCLLHAGSLLGFLFYNTFKAKVFMGDTGSLYLGGLIAITMILSGNVLFIPFFGIMFAVSGISVIIQVAHFKRTGKRVFLMAPLHHHFEYKGHSESKIVFVYKLITLVVGVVCIIFVMRG